MQWSLHSCLQAYALHAVMHTNPTVNLPLLSLLTPARVLCVPVLYVPPHVVLLLPAVQSSVVGAYALHASLGGCGAQELLMALDDAISDTMRELQEHHT
jgi:hypothetical protein